MPEATAPIWEQLAATPLAMFVRESSWAYPALETLHIIGIALVFGSILSYDLRVLGRGRDLSIDSLGRHLLPWVWGGFLLNAASGVSLFLSDAAEFAANPAFRAKLALIVLAGLNAIYFQMRLSPDLPRNGDRSPASLRARLAALLSIALWIGVITAGRMMAYVK